MEKSETKQNYRLGKAEIYILGRAVENMSNKRKLNNEQMCDCEALITFPTSRKIKVNVSNYCNMSHIVNLLIFESLIDFAAKSKC